MTHFLSSDQNEKGEERILALIAYPLEDIVTAQKDFSEKKHVGKIVLLPPKQTSPQQDFIDSLKQ